ncbi:MAG: hypothetical protein HZA50_02405 [Planctomycetes bacterium]|nr:hypothetical protein [Planctomycetota bacterium]
MINKRNLIAAAAFIIAIFGGQNFLPAQMTVPATSEADLKDIAAKCQDIAELLWPAASADSQPASQPSAADRVTDLEKQVKGITYTAENIGLIAPLLKSVSKADNLKNRFITLYVGNRIIKPLILARADVVTKAVPELMEFYRGFSKFEDLPVYSADGLKAFKLPDGAGKDDPKAAPILKARRDKLDKDARIKLHNEQVMALNRSIVELMAISGGLDKELIDMFVKAEKAGDSICMEILDWLRLHVRDLSPERSKTYYDEFARLGQELRNKKAKYVNKSVVALKEDDNSTFETKDEYPGFEILTVVDRVCVLARMPALKVPTKQEIDKANGGGKDPGGKDRPRKNPRTQPAKAD